MAPRHHTVPRMYLRNFADSDHQIMVVSRDDYARTHRSTVKNALAEVGFYRIEVDDLAREEDRATFDPESIEHGLSGLEGDAVPTLDKLLSAAVDTLTDWDRYQLDQFIAIQTARGQRWRDDVTALLTHVARIEFSSQLTEETARDLLVERGKPHAASDVASYLEEVLTSPFPGVVPTKAFLVQESLKMALGTEDHVGLARFLAGRRLRLVQPAEVAVLTGDEPVCWWSPGAAPVGYANAQVVWLPLSPRAIVQLSHPRFDERAHQLVDDDDIARFVNGQVAAQAGRWIVHHPDDSPLETLTPSPRQVWGDELVSVEEDGDERREVWVHRRLLAKR